MDVSEMSGDVYSGKISNFASQDNIFSSTSTSTNANSIATTTYLTDTTTNSLPTSKASTTKVRLQFPCREKGIGMY